MEDLPEKFKFGTKVVVFMTINDVPRNITGTVVGWGKGLDNKDKLKIRIFDSFFYFDPKKVKTYEES